ncbi:hypothetical protein C8F04DRAFT_1197991 [Mycena alexandri]|uniref:Uncharacterized protein n=1 Tax=Mycena alexandri TaxID=1745969 RepID=A0AAD6WND7_9AGAR|nr:hypothetical protein C8F04DRAFT_1197991 [Mycena alexandri]
MVLHLVKEIGSMVRILGGGMWHKMKNKALHAQTIEFSVEIQNRFSVVAKQLYYVKYPPLSRMGTQQANSVPVASARIHQRAHAGDASNDRWLASMRRTAQARRTIFPDNKIHLTYLSIKVMRSSCTWNQCKKCCDGSKSEMRLSVSNSADGSTKLRDTTPALQVAGPPESPPTCSWVSAQPFIKIGHHNPKVNCRAPNRRVVKPS